MACAKFEFFDIARDKSYLKMHTKALDHDIQSQGDQKIMFESDYHKLTRINT
jgi:hypothetical protein